MKITLIAVGAIKPGPEAELIAAYMKRLPWPVTILEIEEKRPLPPMERTKSEGEKILAALPKSSFVVALDKSGKAFNSPALSKQIQSWFQVGGAHITFIIGGSDGLSEAVLGAAQTKLSFGPNTWPHQLARVMLLEQIYRAYAIEEGHPYHK